MKKIVVAADSFKGSLSSKDVAESVEKGISSVFSECEIIKTSIADGGEGTVGAIVRRLGGKFVTIPVSGPLMNFTEARYGLIESGRTAIMEMSAASGLTLMRDNKLDPMKTNTYGTGEMIRDALKRGCRRFLIGLGGSATNDAGTGMLQALGFRFLDKKGHTLAMGGEILPRIETVDTSMVPAEVFESEFIAACDVANPFSGPNGAAWVFGPQKGADKKMVFALDAGLRHLAEVVKRDRNIDLNAVPGSGAAGGMGGGMFAFLGAKLRPGIEIVLETIGFAKIIEGADMVITGEGRIDSQTAMGKAPQGVLRAASQQGIPVVAIAGCIDDVTELNDLGFTGVFSILACPSSLENAMQPATAKKNIRNTVAQLMRSLKAVGCM